MTAFTDGNKGAIILLCKNVTFATDPNFQYINKDSSIAEFETSPIEVSGGDCIASIVIGSQSALANDDFSNLLLPGETLTLSMAVPSAAAADMNASLIWDEDI